MLEVRELRMVRAIQENGSLVRAARVLGVAQPALTRSLASLEAKLRGPLFERSPRGVLVTDLGRAVLAHAEDILGRLEHLDRYLSEVRGGQARDLTVVAGAFLAESLCVGAAGRMLGHFSQIRLRLVTANWAEVPRAVHEREAPFGLLDLRGYQPDPGLEIEWLTPQPGLFVARPGHPLAGREDIDLADILAFPMVFIGRVPTPVQAPLAAAREEARRRGSVHPAFPAVVHESPTVALAALRGTDAVASTTLAIGGAALEGGEAVALRWRAPWVSLHPGIIRLRNRPLGEPEEAFLDLLRGVDREIADASRDWFARAGMDASTG